MKKKLVICGIFLSTALVIIVFYITFNKKVIDTSYKEYYKQVKNTTAEYNDMFKIYKASDYDDGNLLGIRVNHKHEYVSENRDDLVVQYEYSKIIAELAESNKDKIKIPEEISITFIEDGPRNSSGQDINFSIKLVEDKYKVHSIVVGNNYYKFRDLEGLAHTDINYIEYWGRDVYSVTEYEFLSGFKNLAEIYIGSYSEGDDKSSNIREQIHAIVPDLNVVFNK